MTLADAAWGARNVMSKYAHVWLCESEGGPKPVFRNVSPDGVLLGDCTLVPWPEGAVMAINFTAADFPVYAEIAWENLGVHFYGEDSWPIDFPATRKGLGPLVALEFQVQPRLWKDVPGGRWQTLKQNPRFYAQERAMAGIMRGLGHHLPAPVGP